MSDKHNIDSHKLIYHPRRVVEWQGSKDTWEKAKYIYPIYVEMSPVGACNHRCTFCSVDYIGYQSRMLPYDALRATLCNMANRGVKSVMFAGEGEPTLYKRLPEILDYCTNIGIDTSLTTNMVPFNKRTIDYFVRNCSWIKASINAGSPETYAAIHRTKQKDFFLVLKNLEMTVNARNSGLHNCTVGAQILLLPENAHEVVGLGKVLRQIGADYFVVKPYTQSLYSHTRSYQGLKYDQYHKLETELQQLESDSFQVIYRRYSMDKLNESTRSYEKCSATPYFWAYVMANGDLYGCSAYLGNDNFKIGNVIDNIFSDLWEGERRKVLYDYVNTKLDISQCRINCRMDSVNRYLWTLSHPGNHVNFI